MSHIKTIQEERLSEIISLINRIDKQVDLNRIFDEVKQRRRAIGNSLKYNLYAGQKVLVNGNKVGKEEGTIERINRTRAVVKIDETSWNVPFSMIEAIN